MSPGVRDIGGHRLHQQMPAAAAVSWMRMQILSQRLAVTSDNSQRPSHRLMIMISRVRTRTNEFLPRDDTQSAVMESYIVCPRVCPRL